MKITCEQLNEKMYKTCVWKDGRLIETKVHNSLKKAEQYALKMKESK